MTYIVYKYILILSNDGGHKNEKKEMTLADYFNELEKRAKEIEKTDRYNGDGKAIGCILEAGFRMFMED